MAGPVPLMSRGTGLLRQALPRGLFIKGSYKHRRSCRELTGADEEALAKVRESIDFFDLVIALGVEQSR